MKRGIRFSMEHTTHQVEDPAFVKDHKIGLFVVAAGQQYDPRGQLKKPWFHATQAGQEVCFVTVNHKQGRGPAFDLMLPKAMEVLGRGEAVCIHCEQSFHRAPLAVGAFMTAITGKDPDAIMAWLATKRRIATIHTAVSQPEGRGGDADLWEIRKTFLAQVRKGTWGRVPPAITQPEAAGAPPADLPEEWYSGFQQCPCGCYYCVSGVTPRLCSTQTLTSDSPPPVGGCSTHLLGTILLQLV
jgi:hypothetical protein